MNDADVKKMFENLLGVYGTRSVKSRPEIFVSEFKKKSNAIEMVECQLCNKYYSAGDKCSCSEKPLKQIDLLV